MLYKIQIKSKCSVSYLANICLTEKKKIQFHISVIQNEIKHFSRLTKIYFASVSLDFTFTHSSIAFEFRIRKILNILFKTSCINHMTSVLLIKFKCYTFIVLIIMNLDIALCFTVTVIIKA